MNLSALPALLLAWVKNQGAQLLQPGSQDTKASPFKSGVQYEAKVLDNLSNGRHLVHVAGQKMDMALPRNTRPGDTVRLTYLGGGPRPTFLLNQTVSAQVAPNAQPVSLSSTAQQVNALMRFTGQAFSPSVGNTRALPQVTGPASDTRPAIPVSVPSGSNPSAARMESLSPGTNAQAIGSSSRPIVSAEMIGRSAGAGSAASVSGSRPIAANVVMLQTFSAVTQLAPAGAVSPNTALVGQVVDGLRAAIPSSTTLAPNVLAELPGLSRNLLPTRLSQTLSESGLFYEAHLARWAKGELSFESVLREPQARLGRENLAGAKVAELGGMPDEVARLAGKQLQLLEGAPFLWQGFAWPGQWMDWLVEERQPGEGEGETDQASARWVTELHLNLPRMGSIHAHIGLNADRLDLRLTTPEGAIRDAMLAALPELAQGLEASGLRPVSLNVDIPREA